MMTERELLQAQSTSSQNWECYLEMNSPGTPVRINGKIYPTIIDEHGVRRFPENTLFRWLVDSKTVDLNKLSIAVQSGKFSPTEWMEFNMGLGYSVSGLSNFHFLFGEPDAGMFSGLGWDIEDVE